MRSFYERMQNLKSKTNKTVQQIADEVNTSAENVHKWLKNPKPINDGFMKMLFYLDKFEMVEDAVTRNFDDVIRSSLKISPIAQAAINLVGDACKTILVCTDAMEPVIKSGDILFAGLVKDDRSLIWGKPYVIVDTNEEESIRRVFQHPSDINQLELRSEKPDVYPSIMKSYASIQEILKINAIVKSYCPLIQPTVKYRRRDVINVSN